MVKQAPSGAEQILLSQSGKQMLHLSCGHGQGWGGNENPHPSKKSHPCAAHPAHGPWTDAQMASEVAQIVVGSLESSLE